MCIYLDEYLEEPQKTYPCKKIQRKSLTSKQSPFRFFGKEKRLSSQSESLS
jgi:hypothetical protein